jgi:hypothetical protein
MNVRSCVAAKPDRRALDAYACQHRFARVDLTDVLGIRDVDFGRILQCRWLAWLLAVRADLALGCHPWELWPERFNTAGGLNHRRDAGVAQ